MTDGSGADAFAEFLRELKDRSGLSYGVLAKRLHMSTSTLHRYCNGDAVPADYAPAERLARLCKATPEELVELHRRWVLADAGRGKKGAASPSTAPVEPAAPVEAAAPVEPAESAAPVEADEVTDVAAVATPRRRRTALVAAIAVAGVLGAVGLALGLPSGGDGDRSERPGGSVSVAGDDRAGEESTAASPSPSKSSPSASPTATAKDKAREKGTGGKATSTPSASAPAVPLTVSVAPYSWESPCAQRYLVDKPPGEVPPPPIEQRAAAWVAATGAVSSGEQYVTLTVQGTGEETVVVKDLTVQMVGKRSPLAWNDYAMAFPGVGCGGNVPTRSFTVALDATRPAVVPEAGHRDFPFKVSESDPEVYYIRADASAYDVSWFLELNWSSGSRSGTLRIDNKGKPFRTSGNNGRPAYEFPLGGEAWEPAGGSS
ncbi:XRE family transcriptional regulator [Streptomyces aquilus]|uniref:XRE family transcriptional regulator n=1 Tax=Streptomyces aquilus TaxID=2548456 RepID=A0A3S9I599_9ACTN|nr:helix-turn-helix transcriptional regulator [Streptomyces aquilus]AZP19533.1 XRE family transcriptional regulator [Streptomyces aquilus]